MLKIRNLAKATAPVEKLDPAKIEFGKIFCPHMFLMDYRDGQWHDPHIEPLHALNVHPGAVVFQYGQSIFEGMKAFLTLDEKVVLFRPDKNAERFRASAHRMHMPIVDDSFFVEAVNRLVESQRYYVPPRPGSLYIRPTMIGTEPCLGVRSSTEFIFFIIALPAGPYFKEVGTAGSIEILVTQSVGRASPGGTGNVKAAANYAGTLDITAKAKTLGCDQVLFLDTVHQNLIEEFGGMNVFFVQNDVLITPPLADTILAGITRDSVIQVAQDMGIPISEEQLEIQHVVEGINRGDITEAIACGTAAVVTGVRAFHFEDGTVVKLGHKSPGPITTQLYDRLVAIQYAEYVDNHGWVHPVCDVGAVSTHAESTHL